MSAHTEAESLRELTALTEFTKPNVGTYKSYALGVQYIKAHIYYGIRLERFLSSPWMYQSDAVMHLVMEYIP
jgi:hypothetical protein